MDSFQDLSSLALEFQVEPLVKSTREPEKIRKRDQFNNTWQELADMALGVGVETENNNPQQSQGPTEFHTEFLLFPKLPLVIRQIIWGLTVTPRLIEGEHCILPRQEGNRENGWDAKPLIPRALCPLNTVPYGNMPATFWTCFESRNEVAKYYHNIAVVPEDIKLKHGNLPIGTLEKYSRSSKFSDFYFIDKQTLEFESTREEMFSFPLQPSVPFNPDLDIFNFNHVRFNPYAEEDHPDETNLLQLDIPLPAEWKPWRQRNGEINGYLIYPWAVKRVQITPESEIWRLFSYNSTKELLTQMDSAIFENFIFQDLDEFILQDADCMLYHEFDLLKNRENCGRFLQRMFIVEASHDEFAAERSGSTFKVPDITIRPGAKITTRCKNCIAKQRATRKLFKSRKNVSYRIKQYERKMVERYGKDETLWTTFRM